MHSVVIKATGSTLIDNVVEFEIASEVLAALLCEDGQPPV